MTKADELKKECIEDLARLDQKIRKLDRYYVLYTHSYKQGYEKGNNILCVPSEPEFDDFEFFGMVIDMIRDYAYCKNINLGKNSYFKGMVKVLNKLTKGAKKWH